MKLTPIVLLRILPLTVFGSAITAPASAAQQAAASPPITQTAPVAAAPALGDVEHLRQYYIERGYFDVEIPENAVEVVSGPDKLTYVVHVREGRQYHLGAVTVSGNTLMATDALTKQTGLKSGDAFSPLAVEKETDRLTQLFKDAGNAAAAVQAVRQVNAQAGVVDVDFKINETGPTAAARNQPALIPSSVIDSSKLRVQSQAYGSRKDVFNGPTTTLDNFESHITTVNPGQASHTPHTHGNEEMLVVKEGAVEVFINGKTQTAPTGTIIFYASNDWHGVRNTGDVPATYYVFNWRTAKTPATIPPPATTPSLAPTP